MNTHHNSRNHNPRGDDRYNVAFKVSWELHSYIQEIVTRTGMNYTMVCRDLLERGIDAWNGLNAGKLDSPKFRLFKELRAIREQKEIRNSLAFLKFELSEEDFNRHCWSLGEDPESFADIPNPNIRITKRDKCRDFLMLLFIDRLPRGLPSKVVLEAAVERGFGENLTRDVAKNELLIQFKRKKYNGTVQSMWIPPKD